MRDRKCGARRGMLARRVMGAVVTAGNARQQNDPAACLVVAEHKREELGLEPIAWCHSWAAAGCVPGRMGIGPVPAVERLFARSGMSWKDIDLVVLNEAFAPRVLAVLKRWGWRDNDSRMGILNVNGSGISLGHRIGATIGRILANLTRELVRREVSEGPSLGNMTGTGDFQPVTLLRQPPQPREHPACSRQVASGTLRSPANIPRSFDPQSFPLSPVRRLAPG